MPIGIRYRISNRLMTDNTAFYRLSGINPITGNPIYRNSFTHGGADFFLDCLSSKSKTSSVLHRAHVTE